MKRIEFLKRLGLGAAAAVVAPKALAEGLGKEEVINSLFDQKKIKDRIDYLNNNPWIMRTSYKVTGSPMTDREIWDNNEKVWYYAT